MVDWWWETSLPTLSSNYELKDIYNADEFGLFYECLPNKTYQPKSEKSSSRKSSKHASQAWNSDKWTILAHFNTIPC